MPTFPVPRHKDGRLPKITSGWGSTRGGGTRTHKGVDIMYRRNKESGLEPDRLPTGTKHYWMPEKTPAIAVAPGKVIAANYMPNGGQLKIDHGGGFKSVYVHLKKMRVKEQDTVKEGQWLGEIIDDPTNNHDPKHLHFELYWDGFKQDPEPIITKWPTAPMPKDPRLLLWGAVGSVAVAAALGGGIWFGMRRRK